MRIVQINATCGVGSTGKICLAISELLNKKNIDNFVLYTLGNTSHPNAIKCGNDLEVKIQSAKSHIFGNYGFNSNGETKRIIRYLDEINPDIVHLHNIHGHDCNLEKLFSYLKKKNIKIVWTFHDCWAFTAYCPHFTFVNCTKWKIDCDGCSQFRNFSFFLDRSKHIYERKKKMLSHLDMTIVTPSNWLADLVRQSFLKDYPIKVIHNGVDLSVFSPIESDFRKKYSIPNDKKIVLGVAFGFNERKGIDVFIELSRRLPCNHYQIVLVGTDDSARKRLPQNIIAIDRTNNKQELAEIYSSADVFMNPTREDTYPTVNMEAIACGTPVITFRTGGSPESVDDESGSVVERDDLVSLEEEILRICEMQPYSTQSCIEKAKLFNQELKFKEYIELYERISTE